jgi:signal transduction histidine kinase
MGNREQPILLVSDDAALCAAARREFEETAAGLRVAAVSNMETARRILEEDAPEVILPEEASVAEEIRERRGIAPRLDAMVTSLAVHAPVVVIGPTESRKELSTLIAAASGEVLRPELNNPQTGILGNAELLLAEIHRKDDGQLPYGGRQRLETIAALAVRLRETVRRLSQEWESRRDPVQ